MSLALLLSHDFLRFYLVLIHIVSACIAVGIIIFSYIHLICLGFLNRRVIMLEHITVFICFILLFASGLCIIYLDVGLITSIDQLLKYQKLTVKMLVVAMIILNGLFIHFFVLRKILHQNVFSSFHIKMISIVSGISLSSWISAIFVGKAKILIGIITLSQFISLYAGILCMGIIGGLIASRFITINNKFID